MDTQPPQPGPSGSKSGRLTAASSNPSLIGTLQERRHQLVHCEAADATTKHITQDAHLQIVRKTGNSTTKKQHKVGYEYCHTMDNGRQLTVKQTASVRRELCDQLITPRNGKHPGSTRVSVRTVREIEHHDVVSSGILPDECPEKYPR
jgi:hypothetical protein